ncbi:MFS transporter [Streptomyces sp. NPDC000151]|uniref:MFS transporter n=1 Tax=Streptomyces sp. NPDC000151 TaxID=3154244 RepID=UPI00331F84D4
MLADHDRSQRQRLYRCSPRPELTHGGSSTEVGLLTAIPFALALVVMVGNAAWSDRTRRWRAAVAGSLVVGVVALLLGQVVDGGFLRMVLLCVTAAAVYAPYGLFWAVPGELLRFEVVAVAMGLVNALGDLGGFAGPYLVGWLTDVTGTRLTGFVVLAGFLVVAAGLVAFGLRPTAAVLSERGTQPSAATRFAQR